MQPPADWYPDPTGRHEQRYWDGTAWTEHVFSTGVQGLDALEPAPPAAAEDLFVERAPDPIPDDAFVLSSETASRLTRRSATVASTTDDAMLAAMPAPSAALQPTVEGHGITGALVDGTYAERDDAEVAALQNARMLRCRVTQGNGLVARQGTMVAHQGAVTFERQGAGGLGRALKRAATGEGLAMMRVEGHGDVFFADGAQHVFILELTGGAGISVNGRNILAFSSSLRWDIERVKGATLLAGGLFNTTLTGSGWLALVSDGEPVVLRTDEAPTFVDVNALVAWSGGLHTRVVSSVTAASVVGLGSGEAFQMAFDGTGLVIVQPSEGATTGGASA